MPQIAYSHSPVIETALGMEFVPASLEAAQALEIRDRLRETYPRVELHPALPPQPPLGLSGSFFGLSVGSHPNRWWFISEDDSQLIQLQHDRLLLNWRKTPEETAYPRHHNLMPTFFDVLAVVVEALGGVAPISLETDYYNLDTGLPDGTGLAALLTGADIPPERLLAGNTCQLEFSESGRLDERTTQWTLSAQREDDGPARFHIGTRADAAGLSTADVDALTHIFDSLHGLAIAVFDRHTTTAARERWM